jgi:predicted anti-sigma-YlaC factor YlaD
MVSMTGCSIRKMAVNKLGDAFAGSGTSFASDNDPELIGAAVPFSLKLIESLLEQTPNHRALLLAAASGFTQYSYVFVQQQADQTEAKDIDAAKAMDDRALLLYLRARDYGVRGLETQHKGFGAALRQDPKAAAARCGKVDVPFMYWTAAAWGSAISVAKDNPDLVADQPIIGALIDRAAELDPDFNDGSIQQFLITYESVRPGAGPNHEALSKQHFDRAVEITKGQTVSPYVTYAEAISVPDQNRAEFESMLKEALAIDVNARLEWRLANIVMQRRAKWLLSREDQLFLDPVPPIPASAPTANVSQ